MSEFHTSRTPARIACAFGVRREELSKEPGRSNLVFASVDIPPEEADEILAGMDPALRFEVTSSGVSIGYEGWVAAGGLFERLNGRYIITSSDDGEFMQAFPEAHNCVVQHSRAWARRHGRVNVTCEWDPEFTHFDLHDDYYLDGRDWYSAFRTGFRTPQITEPVEFVGVEGSSSLKLAQLVARAGMVFRFANWGPCAVIAAHELTRNFGTLVDRYQVLAGDIWRTAHLQLQQRIADTAEDREYFAFPSRRADTKREPSGLRETSGA